MIMGGSGKGGEGGEGGGGGGPSRHSGWFAECSGYVAGDHLDQQHGGQGTTLTVRHAGPRQPRQAENGRTTRPHQKPTRIRLAWKTVLEELVTGHLSAADASATLATRLEHLLGSSALYSRCRSITSIQVPRTPPFTPPPPFGPSGFGGPPREKPGRGRDRVEIRY